MSILPSVGVYGTDRQAQLLIQLFKAAGFPVTAVWGQTQESAKNVADQLNVSFYTTKIQELLLHNDVHIVCVSGTPHKYAEICMNSLNIGKHVFSSVPAGLTIKDANAMLDAALYYPRLLSLLNHPLRFIPAFVKAKELVKNGYCGDVLFCECSIHTSSLIAEEYNWHCDVAMGGGILQTYGCHIIDILTFLLDEKASEAQGILETFVKHTNKMPSFRQLSSDDFASFQLKFRSGVKACVTLNSHMPDNFQQEIMIVGSKGFLKIVNCDLFGQLKTNEEVDKLYIEERYDQALLASFEECVPGMYLLGMEQLIEGIKMAFKNMHMTTDQGEADKRNADPNLIAEAANFKDGCYTRCVLDSIVQSNQERAWVSVKQPGVSAPDNKFWDSMLLEPTTPNMQEKVKNRTETYKKSSPVISKKNK